jgi:hypothetical protein
VRRPCVVREMECKASGYVSTGGDSRRRSREAFPIGGENPDRHSVAAGRNHESDRPLPLRGRAFADRTIASRLCREGRLVDFGRRKGGGFVFGALVTRGTAAARVLRQLTCGLRGHLMLTHYRRERLSLRCGWCGYETPGWEIGGWSPRKHPPQMRRRTQPTPIRPRAIGRAAGVHSLRPARRRGSLQFQRREKSRYAG